MPRTSRQQGIPALCEAKRAHIVSELRRILTAHGEAEVPGSAPRRIEVLRANVRAELNRVCETTVDLLAHNARVREVCGVLLAHLEQPHDLTMTIEERFCRETQLEGRINDLQALELTRSMSSADRAQLIQALYDYRGLLAGWIEAEQATQYGVHARTAA